MLGAFLALLSAVALGLNNSAVRHGMVSGSVTQAMAITVPIGVPLFIIGTILVGQFGALFAMPLRSIGYFTAAGVLNFVWGRACNYRATKALGGNLAGPVQQASLIVAVVVAITWLNESLTAAKAVGIVFIIVGSAVAAAGRRRRVSTASVHGAAPFQPKLLEGYTFALLSTIGFGLSPVLIKKALEDSNASVAGGLLAFVAATVVLALIALLPGKLAEIRSVRASDAKWFVFCGVAAFFAQLCRFTALGFAPVTVVTPIQRTGVIFRLGFNMVLNRGHEVLDRRVVSGIVVSLSGAIILGLGAAG